jgi:hypothetical protein
MGRNIISIPTSVVRTLNQKTPGRLLCLPRSWELSPDLSLGRLTVVSWPSSLAIYTLEMNDDF